MELVKLKIEGTQKNLIVQSNKLTEARYSLSVGEQRIVLTTLSFISPEDQAFKRYRLDIWDLKKMLHLSTNAVYDQVKEALERLSKRSVIIDKKDGGYLIANWFSSAEYVPSENAVYMRIDEELKPYLLQLKAQFTRFNLFTVAHFRSAYTIRIYMLLKQYESIGLREFDLIEFREILGIEEEQYPRFDSLRSRIINQAKNDFEKKDKNGFYSSDITFELETIRSGRKISRLRFIIKRQPYQKNLDLSEPSEEHSTLEAKGHDFTTIGKLQDMGISKAKSEVWLEQYGTDYLTEKIAYAEQQKELGKIKNGVSGFLYSAVTENWKSKTEDEKKEAKKTAKGNEYKFKRRFLKLWEEHIKIYYFRKEIDEIKENISSENERKLKKEVHNKLIGISLDNSEDSPMFQGLFRELIKTKFVVAPSKEQLKSLASEVPPPTMKELGAKYDKNLISGIETYMSDFSVSLKPFDAQ